jgi:hypothetical protein
MIQYGIVCLHIEYNNLRRNNQLPATHTRTHIIIIITSRSLTVWIEHWNHLEHVSPPQLPRSSVSGVCQEVEDAFPSVLGRDLIMHIEKLRDASKLKHTRSSIQMKRSWK